ncbi:MAG: T9SS type A sorting domain-containing protein [Ignavibacteria bacterium]|nr:T9SS type A sorting domain-containing protein [Ignavibacteria bacterium]
MKRTGTFLLFMVLCAGLVIAAPRVKIVTEYVTPQMLATNSAFTQDSTVASGLRSVAKGTYVYLRAWNFGDTAVIQTATWTMLVKPAGSTATLAGLTGLPTWQKFKADLTGTYQVQVSVTTSTGSKDTTVTVHASTFVGTGGFDNIPAAFPNCMSCHGTTPQFQDIFNRWKVTGHATSFKTGISTLNSGFGPSCFKCHTMGYDHNIVASNNGFDDKARDLGWNWSSYSPPKPGNWDTIKNRFPTLAPFAGVGCESCHGPGSEHVFAGGDTTKMMKSVNEGVCAQCHDSPPNAPIFTQWKNAKHSNVVWSSSFAQNNNGTNDLGNCIRCHDGQGYVNFTKGIGTNTNGYPRSKHEMVSCATCHDPHGNSNVANLRNRPAGSDTLANGYHYTGVGTGATCMDCHKSRRNTSTYVNTRVTSSTWGPHHNSQADIYLGQNLATFGGAPYRSTQHFSFLQNACVTCHMAPTDTAAANRDKVGGHALFLHNEATDYDHLKACQSCHFGKTRFDQFIADADYDADGTTEAWRLEVAGCLTRLAIQLPPVGVDSVAWQLIAADSNNVTLRKAYINYLSIRDGSEFGMHNAKYVIDALVASRNALIGITTISYEVPERFELTQNYPNPFNPTTRFKFSLPKESDVQIVVFDIMGRVVKVLAKEKYSAGKYEVDWNGTNSMNSQVASGVYFYKIVAGGYTDVKKMIMLK